MTSARRTPHTSIVLLLFFISGASALVYEVIWLRKLVLIFGSTLFATSTVLSTFMGGLALGAFVAGKIEDRRRFHPLRLYGILEIAIGVYALAVPTLLDSLSPIYKAIWEAGASESFLVLSLAKFVGIAAVLLPPTVLMGASLPVLARQVADDAARIGGKVGSLYAVNTFGAVAGTFIAGFIAVPWVGVRATIWITAAVNILIGVAALLMAKRIASPSAEPAPEKRRAADRMPRPARVWVALAAFGVSGFAAMALEVAWTRALGLVFGSSVYAFALMLLAFLAGLAIGSAIFSALLSRRPDLDPGTLLAVLLGSAGVLAYATAFVFEKLPLIFAQIYFDWRPPPEGWFAVQFLLSLLVMFPATVAFGGIFPTVVQLHARGLDRVSGSVGTVYASNTVGTIFGAAAAGFFLVPQLGVRNTVVLMAAAEIVLGLLVALLVMSSGLSRKLAFAAAMAASLVVVGVARPGWDVLLMNSGVYINLQDLPEDSDWKDFRKYTQENTVPLYAREGLTASVIVADQPAYSNRYLAVNGKVEASTSNDMETQLMAVHLPLLLHPDPTDVMVIGLASGITVGAAATHGVERIKVVEVEEAMVPAARLFSEFNGNVLDDPRVEISVNDARNDLEFSADTYDVIASEPSNPWMTVAANLFTEDFFHMARTRLRPGGIFSQWLHTYYLPTEDMRSIIAAFRSAFPNVWVFETFEGIDLLLLGSDHPLELDLEGLELRMADLRIRMDLARVNVRSPVDLLPLFRLGDAEVERLIDGAPRNTDDNARVEFSAPKALYSDTLEANLDYLERFAADPMLYVKSGATSPAGEEVRLELARAWARRGNIEKAASEARTLLDGPLKEDAEAFLKSLNL